MPNIDPKITVPEGQVVHKRTLGHNHDGITSTLIDTSSYSLYDFTMGVRETNLTTTRGRRQAANELAFKSLVVAAIEERVLQPQGVVLKANSITATEIAANTINADNLSANLVLVNNIIRSNNYQNSVLGKNGWIIYSNGKAEFNDVTIRGNLIAGNGYYGANNTSIFANSTGYFSLGSNFTWDGNALTINGTVTLSNTNIGTFDNGDALTSGTIGGITISSSYLSGSSANGSFTLYSNGAFVTANGSLTGATSNSGVGFSETRTFNVSNSYIGGYSEYNDTLNNLRIETSTDLTWVWANPGLYIQRDTYNAGTNAFISTSGYIYDINGPVPVSDIRVKNIYDENCNTLEQIKKIKVIRFAFKGDPEQKQEMGFSAQQVYDVIPEIVYPGNEDPQIAVWRMSKEKLIPYLTRAIQELSEKIEYLENRLNQIEGV